MSGAEPNIKVSIKGRGEQAIISIPGNTDPELITPELLCCYAEAEGVALSQPVRDRLKDVAESFREDPADTEMVFAEARAPVPGQDGGLAWEEGYDPTPECEEAGPDQPESEGVVDHYQGQKFVTVEADTHVATLREPTDGTDGQNVLGENLVARSGKPCTVTIDQATLLVDGQQRVLTQAEGVLKLQHNTLTVTKLLEIDGNVDFKTGNIDFDGSVNIREGVRDRFEVKARGCVQVGGLVEAARIVCTGDLICRRGIASRDRGRIAVGGNAEIGFLNNVRGNIHGDLNSRREIINCELVIGGSMHCAQGSVIGGNLVVGGGIEVGKLGSDGHVPTIVRLGEVPVLSGKLKRIKADLADRAARLETKQERESTLLRASSSLSSFEKEESTELRYEIDELQQEIEALEAQLTEIEEMIRQSRNVNVEIRQMLYSKVTFRLGTRQIEVTRDTKGPLKVGWSEDRQLVYRIADGPLRAITGIARVSQITPEENSAKPKANGEQPNSSRAA